MLPEEQGRDAEGTRLWGHGSAEQEQAPTLCYFWIWGELKIYTSCMPEMARQSTQRSQVGLLLVVTVRGTCCYSD